MADEELGYSPEVAADQQSRNDVIREQVEREFGLKQQQLSQQMAIARMQSGNSRAATAASAAAARGQLKLATRRLQELDIPELELKRWVAQKNNELARATFGLDVLRTGVEYNSTPDKYWMARDFEGALPGLLGNSLRAPTSAPNQQPNPNNLADLVAQYGLGPTMSGGGAGSGSAPPGSSAYGDGGQQGGMISTQDAAKAVIDANPPSQFAGYSDADRATLASIGKIFEQGLDFKSFDQLNPNQKGMLIGGGKRLGRSTDTDIWRMNESRPGQGSASAA